MIGCLAAGALKPSTARKATQFTVSILTRRARFGRQLRNNRKRIISFYFFSLCFSFFFCLCFFLSFFVLFLTSSSVLFYFVFLFFFSLVSFLLLSCPLSISPSLTYLNIILFLPLSRISLSHIFLFQPFSLFIFADDKPPQIHTAYNTLIHQLYF